MSVSLATSLADEFAVGATEASRFVDDVGPDAARELLENSGSAADGLLDDWQRPLGIAGGVGAAAGAGTLLYRQQDVAEARAIAEQSSNYSEAAQAIIQSDLSPEARQDALNGLNEQDGSSGGGSGSGGESGPAGGLLGGSPQTTIILIIAMVFVLKFGLEGDE